MKLTAKLPPKAGLQLTFEGEIKTQKDAFKMLSGIQEAHSVSECGRCGGTDFRYIARENDGNNFFEMGCRAKGCYAKLSFGQEKGTDAIYPRIRYHKQHPLVVDKKANEGDLMPHGGWEKYEKPKG